MIRKKKKAGGKGAESAASKGHWSKLAKRLPKVQRGTPAPLIWAASGALLGLALSLGSASMSRSVGQDLEFLGLILSRLLNSFPIAMAGALLGAFVALGWYGCRR